ncbi:MAG TPA: low molecular weight protein arginine phosphatase [Clostridiales bacterium]|jgi:protein-tyrosine-phosphatase|nr:low molecular weight protein arginine phosphatase [Clostridiales bacterium]
MKIIFACSGNTCRSPMAEAVFKKMLKDEGVNGVEVESRGVVANVGADISENAKKALKSAGIPFKKHSAKQITTDDILNCDFVICMTERHRMRLGCLPKVFTLGQMTGCGDIVDPYGKDEETYKECLKEIQAALTKLMPLIKRQLSLQ